MTGEKIWEKSIIMTDVISFTVSFITNSDCLVSGRFLKNELEYFTEHGGRPKKYPLFIPYLYFFYE